MGQKRLPHKTQSISSEKCIQNVQSPLGVFFLAHSQRKPLQNPVGLRQLAKDSSKLHQLSLQPGENLGLRALAETLVKVNEAEEKKI